MTAVRDFRVARRFPGHAFDQLLDPLHLVAIVGVGLVPLQHRELGDVLVGQAFVAEVLAELVDLLQSADDQPLEIELGGDPQVVVGVEGVVVRHEGLREAAAVARLQDRRLDLEEALLVEVAPDGAHDAGTQFEVGARVLVHQ